MGFKNKEIITKIKIDLIVVFRMLDMRLISFFLSLKIKQDQENSTIKFFQLAYIQKVLVKYHFDEANIINILIKKTILELGSNLSTKATQAEKEKY